MRSAANESTPVGGGSGRSTKLDGIAEHLFRHGTFDAAIWDSIEYEYPTLPESVEPDDVVVDVGCHTGAFCDLAARRGATVVGYEANRENYALAAINLRDRTSVTLHHTAVWRSDLTGPTRLVDSTPAAM